MSKNLILLSIIFIISGCGMMGSHSKKNTTLATNFGTDRNITDSSTLIANSEGNGTNELNSSIDTSTPTITVAKTDILPQTISMDFPDILVDTKEENNQTDDTNNSTEDNSTQSNITDGNSTDDNLTDNNQSTAIINNIGYNQLKKNISQIKDIVTIAQVNLVLLEKVMPQVLDKCEGMMSCVFEPKYLSIVLDNETISQIDNITKDSNFTIKVEDNVTNKLLLGKISFSKYYDYNRTYDYELTLDMVSDNINLVYEKLDNNISDSNITDKNKTDINISEYQNFKWSEDNKNVITKYFYQDNNKTVDISIFYLVDEVGKETMHVVNNNKNIKHQENMNLTLSEDEDDNTTVLLQSNSIEQFNDGNDTNISSFSANGEISDDSSTLLFAGSSSNNSSTSEISCDNNSSCDENSSLDINDHLELHELNITDGNLTDGSYILLPPYINIKDLKLIDIFKLTLGTFTVFHDKAQGEIHNNSYNDMIDQLTIVKMNESQNSINMFEVVPKKDRPIIKIVNE